MATILLVDDEDLLREGVREILEMSDHTVIEAGDGQQALEKFAVNNVDLVITDVVMPNMDGVDFVTKLRELFPDVPILTISGGSRVVSARFGLDSALLSGANASLTKPFNAKQLLEKVSQLLPA
ncbi:response regulator transcription factor [Ramlibacter sp. MAHUQ-53]|uniref:response regulator transcription factor n=1 Tax=unclassified Ramlibacter TaxID=2617605 RepID=UPI003644F23B